VFFLLAYAASWAMWLPLTWWTPSDTTRQALLIAGTFGPSVAAALVIVGRRGLPGLRLELAEQWQWRLFLILPVFLYVVILGGPLGEEFGWRGFALPHLEQRIHPAAAVILLGVVWGLWHLPLFWIEGTVQQQTPLAAFLAQTTVTSVIYGWLWNKTRSPPQ
jgi:membrane protease YdiL (CAAX protease family)